MSRIVIGALSVLGGFLIVVGLAVIVFVAPSTSASASLSATLPGASAGGATPSPVQATPVVTIQAPTQTSAAPPLTPTRLPTATATTTRPVSTPTPGPVSTPTPGPVGTATPIPGPPSPTLTSTPQTCPTPVTPGLFRAATATPTSTPTPRGVPPCRTPTPSVTPTRAPIIIGGFLHSTFFGLSGTTWMQADKPAPLSDASSVRFGLNYPSRMQAGLSETISVTLTRNAQGTVQATVGTPGVVNLVVSPLPVGTPGAPLEQARGANYAAFAVARIPATSGVQIQLSSPSNEEQSLDNATITWYWSVVSQTPGLRKMRLDFELRFKPKASGAPAVPDQPMWSPEIEIDVRDQNVLAVGPVSIPTNNLGQTIVQAGLGSQIPLIIAWIRGKLHGKPAEPPVPGKRKRGKTP